MMRILVGGATGHLGGELIPVLLDRGHEVFALVRPGSEGKLGEGRDRLAGIRVAELTDPDALSRAVDGIDVVVSTIGMTTPVRGVDPDQVDHLGNVALLRAAESAGIGHFAYVSVAGIEDPKADRVPVVEAKRRFEAALRNSPIGWSIARPSGFFWNYGIFLSMAREKSMIPIIGDGSARSTPVDAKDLAVAIADRMGVPNHTYSVGGPEDLTVNEISDLIHRVLDRKIRCVHIPLSVARGAVAVAHPFNASQSDMARFFVWAMTADVTADHVGTTRLEDWMRAHRDERFSV